VRRLLAAGAIGEVRQVVISARGHRRPGGWRRSVAVTGGGALIDGGIHYVHLLRAWGGPVAAVSAAAPSNLFADVEGEDTAFALFRFRRGGVGLLANSLAAPGLPRGQTAWITGATGSLGVDNRGRYLILRGAGRSRLRVFLRDRRGLAAQLRAFVAAVAEGRPPALPPASTRQDLAVVVAAYRAIATGQVVPVDDVDP
jgi:predicted dehydrogenase